MRTLRRGWIARERRRLGLVERFQAISWRSSKAWNVSMESETSRIATCNQSAPCKIADAPIRNPPVAGDERRSDISRWRLVAKPDIYSRAFHYGNCACHGRLLPAEQLVDSEKTLACSTSFDTEAIVESLQYRGKTYDAVYDELSASSWLSLRNHSSTYFHRPLKFRCWKSTPKSEAVIETVTTMPLYLLSLSLFGELLRSSKRCVGTSSVVCTTPISFHHCFGFMQRWPLIWSTYHNRHCILCSLFQSCCSPSHVLILAHIPYPNPLFPCFCSCSHPPSQHLQTTDGVVGNCNIYSKDCKNNYRPLRGFVGDWFNLQTPLSAMHISLQIEDNPPASTTQG